MDKTTHQIALENEVLHGAKNNFPLFYNRDFDLGKHLEPSKPSSNAPSQISLTKMNVATKNITPPINSNNSNNSSRDFLFIKK